MTLEKINKQNKGRAIGAVIFSFLLIVIVAIGVTMRLFERSELTGNEGLATYRMFTVDSNVMVSVCAMLSIPYMIDGIVNENFHMPKWILYVLYIGTTSVTMTFFISVAILSPVAGFKEILFSRSNLFLHVLGPFFAIGLFVFVAHVYNIDFKFTFIGIVPIFIYATVYAIMVFGIGEANGGWRDHYQFNKYIPWPLTALLMLSIAFGLATLLRVAHNKMHKSYRNNVHQRYFNCEDFKDKSVDEIIRIIAIDNRKYAKKNRVIPIPMRIINLFIENKQTDLTLEELCIIYIDEYLKKPVTEETGE